MTRIYISGQITGLDIEEAKQNFLSRQHILEAQGYEVLNPFDICPYQPHLKWEDYMRADIDALFKADAIYMLNNWKQSKGAIIEHQIAANLKLKIIYEPS